LSESKYRIALDDLITREVDSVTSVVRGDAFDMVSGDTSGAAVLARLQRYEAASTTLIQMAFVAGQWSEEDQLAPWIKAIVRLAQRRANSGLSLWLDLQAYPATLLLYAFGLGAIVSARWKSLSTLLKVKVQREHMEDKRVVELTPIWALFQRGGDVMKILPERERQFTPLNNHVEEMLWSLLGSSFSSQLAFQLAFDKFEILTALNYAVPTIQSSGRYWTLPGIYGWRRNNLEKIFLEFKKELEVLGNASTLVASELVGVTAAQGLENLGQFSQFVPQFRWR
jgi:hypothetical protein